MKKTEWFNCIESMAKNCHTCDSIVNESFKKLTEEDVAKVSPDTRFIDLWVTKEVYDEDYELEDGEEQEYVYTIKDVSQFIIQNPNFKIVFESSGKNPALVSEEIIDNEDYLFKSVHSTDYWWYHALKHELNGTVGLAEMVSFFGSQSEEDENQLITANKVISEVFELMKKYDSVGLIKYIQKNGLEIDKRKGTIKFPFESLDTQFDIILYPEA